MTKIICTVSDERCDVDFLRSLHERGMDVVRINSAHATIEGAQKVIDNVRTVSDRLAILIDTKGPEVRLTDTYCSEGIIVEEGDIIEIHSDTGKMSTREHLNTNCDSFVNDVPTGAEILIDDGSIKLKVVSKDSDRLICRVMNPGSVKGRKSINVPDVHISLPALTDKDRKFVEWAIKADIDFIAHSFVRSSNDLKEIQDMVDAAGSPIKIISKIENQQGLDNLEDILASSYGVLIARGDLGVEIPEERLPLIQRDIVLKSRIHRKPVIIATQMLHSMIENPRPTRAEVTDVANAIFQHTDAIMLSGETANGKYPFEAVETMCRIATEAEKSLSESLDISLDGVLKPIAATLARNLVEASRELPVKAIIFDTWTGRTGRYLAEFRPKVPLYAMCYRQSTLRELSLTYGITGFPFEIKTSKEEMVNGALEILLKEGRIGKGDLVGFIGGSFNDELGATYMEFKYV